jgi:uncharacterized membrane protein/YHS domain-containing protein
MQIVGNEMVFYFVTIVHAFVPAAFLAGLVASRSQAPLHGRTTLACLSVVAGLAIGWGIFAIASRHRGIVDATTVLRFVVAVAAAGVLALLAAGGRRGDQTPALNRAFVLVVLVVLSAVGAFDALVGTADRQLSVTGVINTELVVNLAAIAVAAVVVACLAPLVAHAARGAGRAVMVASAALGFAIVAAVGDIMLGLLQLGHLEASSARITLVAKIDQIDPFVTYVELAAVALLGIASYFGRPRLDATVAAGPAPALRRKHLAVSLAASRWLRGTVAAAAALVVVLLYQDLYASQPPRLSDAVEVEPDATDHIAIAIDRVKDGALHRFAYISSDGHRVRFFLINRYGPDRPRIGVVYDACMLCGDDGYIQVGNEVICVSCNVRIHVPSIGTAGGCNPIPLPHQVEEETIRIAAADLEKGARFFSEIVKIEVHDPVNGARLTNVAAPFQDTHDGRVVFFTGKDTYDAFRADPDKYVPRRRPSDREGR